ncbi:molecular chaperone (plasmid) [Hafnia alvei]|nr:molecular chaperone [Hafnia alvei]
MVVNQKNIFQSYKTSTKVSFLYLLFIAFTGLYPVFSLAEIPENAFGFTSTRIVYNENGNKGTPLSFINNTNKSYLIMPTIYEADNDGNKSEIRSTAFVVAPFLKKSQPFSEEVMKVVRTGGDLPDNVESLFYLSSVLIPSQPSTAPKRIAVEVGYRWNMKILYRPLSLKNEKIRDSIEKLKVTKDKNKVKLTNNSPLWLTIINLKIDGKKFNERPAIMIRPFSSTLLNTLEPTVSSINLQIVDEEGHHLPQGGKEFIF